VIVDTVGGHAFVDPFLPCVVLVNAMRHRGGVRAGELLVTGSFSGFFEVEPDEPVTAEFVGFGSAVATFASR
jgi:2-keto-4-pentenoate hydratase